MSHPNSFIEACVSVQIWEHFSKSMRIRDTLIRSYFLRLWGLEGWVVVRGHMSITLDVVNLQPISLELDWMF